MHCGTTPVSAHFKIENEPNNILEGMSSSMDELWEACRKDDVGTVEDRVPPGNVVIDCSRDNDELFKTKYKWTIHSMNPYKYMQLIVFWIVANACAIFVYSHYNSILFAIFAQIIVSPLCDIPIKIAVALAHWNR